VVGGWGVGGWEGDDGLVGRAAYKVQITPSIQIRSPRKTPKKRRRQLQTPAPGAAPRSPCWRVTAGSAPGTTPVPYRTWCAHPPQPPAVRVGPVWGDRLVEAGQQRCGRVTAGACLLTGTAFLKRQPLSTSGGSKPRHPPTRPATHPPTHPASSPPPHVTAPHLCHRVQVGVVLLNHLLHQEEVPRLLIVRQTLG